MFVDYFVFSALRTGFWVSGSGRTSLDGLGDTNNNRKNNSQRRDGGKANVKQPPHDVARRCQRRAVRALCAATLEFKNDRKAAGVKEMAEESTAVGFSTALFPCELSITKGQCTSQDTNKNT